MLSSVIEKAKNEAVYIEEVAKGVDKVLSSNSDKQDKGRPLSLQHDTHYTNFV